MNIDGVNLSSLLPGNSAIEGGAQSLPENGAIPEDFSNALMGQLALLSEATGQVELPGQLPGMTMSQFQAAPNRMMGEIPPTDSSGRIGPVVNEEVTKKDSPARAALSNIDNPPEGRGFRPARYFDDLLKYKGKGEELAASFDDYLPLSYKKSEDVNLEATLLTITDALKPLAPTSTPDAAATAQNPKLAITDALEPLAPASTPDAAATAQNPKLAITDALEPLVPASTPDAAATVQNPKLAITDALKPLAPTSTPDAAATVQNRKPAITDALKPLAPTSTPDAAATVQNPKLAITDALKPLAPTSTPDAAATVQNRKPAITDALEPLAPTSTPDEAATAQNMSAVMALNSLFFVKPPPEEAKFNKSGEEDVISGDFLQKETVLRQSIQDKQGVNLQSVENAEPAEKTRVIDKQAVISGVEKTASGVTVDMAPFHRPIDNRTDSPAITRPLTHPDWSKDLGEQIVWMNNKTLPTAEIKLNPAHLGPISVRIDVNQDQATIVFTAQHAEVKEAIEASIPKLREMLGTQQLNLINVNISHNSASDQGRSQSQPFSKAPENNEQGIDGVTDSLEKNEHDRVIVNKGLLSLYA